MRSDTVKGHIKVNDKYKAKFIEESIVVKYSGDKQCITSPFEYFPARENCFF